MLINLKGVSHALDAVRSAGQAQAAAQAGLAASDGTHATIRQAFAAVRNPFEGFNWNSLKRATDKVRQLSAAVQGPTGAIVRTSRADGGPGKPVASWAALHAALLALYGEIYAVQLFQPAVQWRDSVNILTVSIKEAPGVFVRGVRTVARAAGEAAADVAGGAGSIVWAVLKPLLPVIGIVVGVAVVSGGVFLLVKGKVGA
jgi:hypothetical protein